MRGIRLRRLFPCVDNKNKSVNHNLTVCLSFVLLCLTSFFLPFFLKSFLFCVHIFFKCAPPLTCLAFMFSCCIYNQGWKWGLTPNTRINIYFRALHFERAVAIKLCTYSSLKSRLMCVDHSSGISPDVKCLPNSEMPFLSLCTSLLRILRVSRW